MSEIGETYEAIRQRGKEKRAANRCSSPQLLSNVGLSFTSHNAGAHLVVENRVDFWPGTGKWIMRDGSGKGRGVKGLIKALAGTST